MNYEIRWGIQKEQDKNALLPSEYNEASQVGLHQFALTRWFLARRHYIFILLPWTMSTNPTISQILIRVTSHPRHSIFEPFLQPRSQGSLLPVPTEPGNEVAISLENFSLIVFTKL